MERHLADPCATHHPGPTQVHDQLQRRLALMDSFLTSLRGFSGAAEAFALTPTPWSAAAHNRGASVDSVLPRGAPSLALRAPLEFSRPELSRLSFLVQAPAAPPLPGPPGPCASD